MLDGHMKRKKTLTLTSYMFCTSIQIVRIEMTRLVVYKYKGDEKKTQSDQRWKSFAKLDVPTTWPHLTT